MPKGSHCCPHASFQFHLGIPTASGASKASSCWAHCSTGSCSLTGSCSGPAKAHTVGWEGGRWSKAELRGRWCSKGICFTLASTEENFPKPWHFTTRGPTSGGILSLGQPVVFFLMLICCALDSGKPNCCSCSCLCTVLEEAMLKVGQSSFPGWSLYFCTMYFGSGWLGASVSFAVLLTLGNPVPSACAGDERGCGTQTCWGCFQPTCCVHTLVMAKWLILSLLCSSLKTLQMKCWSVRPVCPSLSVGLAAFYDSRIFSACSNSLPSVLTPQVSFLLSVHSVATKELEWDVRAAVGSSCLPSCLPSHS